MDVMTKLAAEQSGLARSLVMLLVDLSPTSSPELPPSSRSARDLL
jgi:hypothetical protein